MSELSKKAEKVIDSIQSKGLVVWMHVTESIKSFAKAIDEANQAITESKKDLPKKEVSKKEKPKKNAKDSD